MTGPERYAYNNYILTQEGKELASNVGEAIVNMAVPAGPYGISNADQAFNNIANIVTEGGLNGMAAADFIVNTAEGYLGRDLVNLPSAGNLIHNTYKKFVPEKTRQAMEIDGKTSFAINVAATAAQLGQSLTQAEATIIKQVPGILGANRESPTAANRQGFNITDTLFRSPDLAQQVRFGTPEVSPQRAAELQQAYDNVGLNWSEYAESDAGFLQKIGQFVGDLKEKTKVSAQDIAFAYQKNFGGAIQQGAVASGVSNLVTGTVGNTAIPMAPLIVFAMDAVSEALLPQSPGELSEFLAARGYDTSDLGLGDISVVDGKIAAPGDPRFNLPNVLDGGVGEILSSVVDNVLSGIPFGVGDWLSNTFGIYDPANNNEFGREPTLAEIRAHNEEVYQAHYENMARLYLEMTPEEAQAFLDSRFGGSGPYPYDGESYEDLVQRIDEYYNEVFPEQIERTKDKDTQNQQDPTQNQQGPSFPEGDGTQGDTGGLIGTGDNATSQNQGNIMDIMDNTTAAQPMGYQDYYQYVRDNPQLFPEAQYQDVMSLREQRDNLLERINQEQMRLFGGDQGPGVYNESDALEGVNTMDEQVYLDAIEAYDNRMFATLRALQQQYQALEERIKEEDDRKRTAEAEHQYYLDYIDSFDYFPGLQQDSSDNLPDDNVDDRDNTTTDSTTTDTPRRKRFNPSYSPERTDETPHEITLDDGTKMYTNDDGLLVHETTYAGGEIKYDPETDTYYPDFSNLEGPGRDNSSGLNTNPGSALSNPNPEGLPPADKPEDAGGVGSSGIITKNEDDDELPNFPTYSGGGGFGDETTGERDPRMDDVEKGFEDRTDIIKNSEQMKLYSDTVQGPLTRGMPDGEAAEVGYEQVRRLQNGEPLIGEEGAEEFLTTNQINALYTEAFNQFKSENRGRPGGITDMDAARAASKAVEDRTGIPDWHLGNRERPGDQGQDGQDGQETVDPASAVAESVYENTYADAIASGATEEEAREQAEAARDAYINTGDPISEVFEEAYSDAMSRGYDSATAREIAAEAREAAERGEPYDFNNIVETLGISAPGGAGQSGEGGAAQSGEGGAGQAEDPPIDPTLTDREKSDIFSAAYQEAIRNGLDVNQARLAGHDAVAAAGGGRRNNLMYTDENGNIVPNYGNYAGMTQEQIDAIVIEGQGDVRWSYSELYDEVTGDYVGPTNSSIPGLDPTEYDPVTGDYTGPASNVNLDGTRFGEGGGTFDGAPTGAVQYGDEYDPTFGLLKVLYGEEIAQRYRGGGLAQTDVQYLIDRYERSIQDLAFNRTATLAQQEQGLVNELRGVQRADDLALLRGLGQPFSAALIGSDPISASQLFQQQNLSNRLYNEAAGNFSRAREAEIMERAFQTSALQGRERDPSLIYERLLGAEDLRASREARAQAAGANTFNMSRDFTRQVPNLLLGADSSPYARGVGTIAPVFGSTDAVNTSLQNYQNQQNYLDNQNAQAAYSAAVAAAQATNDLSMLEKLDNFANNVSSGIETFGNIYALLKAGGGLFSNIADNVGGPIGAVAGAVAGGVGAVTGVVDSVFSGDDDTDTGNPGAVAGGVAAGGAAAATGGGGSAGGGGSSGGGGSTGGGASPGGAGSGSTSVGNTSGGSPGYDEDLVNAIIEGGGFSFGGGGTQFKLDPGTMDGSGVTFGGAYNTGNNAFLTDTYGNVIADATGFDAIDQYGNYNPPQTGFGQDYVQIGGQPASQVDVGGDGGFISGVADTVKDTVTGVVGGAVNIADTAVDAVIGGGKAVVEAVSDLWGTIFGD